MTKEIWINLPVKDVAKAKAFFVALGFAFKPSHSNASMAAMSVSEKNIALMLFQDTTFRHINQCELADTAKVSEVLFSLDAESKAEVDEWATKVVAAGGTVFSRPAEVQGWMYGCGFADLDGHRWNVLYMDRSKMPR